MLSLRWQSNSLSLKSRWRRRSSSLLLLRILLRMMVDPVVEKLSQSVKVLKGLTQLGFTSVWISFTKNQWPSIPTMGGICV